MHELLKESFPRMVIEANDHVDDNTMSREYNSLLENIDKTSLETRERLSAEEDQFVKGLCRHFTEEVATRVKIVINLLGSVKSQTDLLGDSMQKTRQEINLLNFWKGKNEVNTLIEETFTKWKKQNSEQEE